jgi:pimeloyl-ACP methyl ester carboxylesterase
MRMVLALMAGLIASPALAQKEPIALRDMGSFHIGGRHIEVKGLPIKEVLFSPGGVPAKMDPNGTYQVEQMYVQYFLQQKAKGKLPLLMWHGGGLTGVTYETKPDGQPGWLNYFIRQGWDTYISDAVERGRSGWTDKFKGEPIFLPVGDPWERFRIGPAGSWNDDKAKRATYPGVQFPTDAYEQFMKQGVPRWVTTDDQIVAAYIELVDKVCPCVVLVHSQAGNFGFRVAEARPDKVKALVSVEPSVPGTRDKVAALKMPIVVIYGDNAREHPRWGKIRQNVHDYLGLIRQAGGSVDTIDLPDVGIKGNTHMMMMDKNSDQVADVIQKWLIGKGLVD